VNTDRHDLQRELEDGLASLNLTTADDVVTKLLHYVAMLVKWNRTYNLTAIREPKAMISRHLLDSLAVMPYICGPNILDVGTGAGLPGIPLALMNLDFNWVLLDSNGKKTRFVTQAVAELGLNNVTVVTGRVAEQGQVGHFNTVISRAFSNLNAFIEGAGHLCRPDGQLLAMKGIVDEAELKQIPPNYTAEHILLQVPALDAQRCIIKLVIK